MTDVAGLVEKLAEALEPFAAFADLSGLVPDDHIITQGSPMARRQLTMGDCRKAAAALRVRENAND